jgi:predicted ArsR family transcriptional regulator
MPHGTLGERVRAASDLLNDLGGITEADEEGSHFVIRGHGCPLAAATAEYPEACNALESLLSEFVGQPTDSRTSGQGTRPRSKLKRGDR